MCLQSLEQLIRRRLCARSHSAQSAQSGAMRITSRMRVSRGAATPPVHIRLCCCAVLTGVIPKGWLTVDSVVTRACVGSCPDGAVKDEVDTTGDGDPNVFDCKVSTAHVTVGSTSLLIHYWQCLKCLH